MTRLAVALLAALPGMVAAQSAAPRFEVASVRLSSDARGPNVVSPARVDYVYASLSYLIQQAYRVPAIRYEGPGALNQVRVDIHAIPPLGSTRAQIPDMLKTLLAERFGLVAHFEQRLVEVSVLEVGPGGIKMREVEPLDELSKEYVADPRWGTARLPDSISETLDGQRRTSYTIVDDLVGMRTTTERSLYEDLRGENQKRELNAVRITMSEFANVLNSALGEQVVDRTGLTSLYQFRIPLPTPTGVVARLRQIGITTNPAGEPLEELPSGISAHKSVETLGLKLEKKRIPLDVLVVDKIARTPKEN